MKDFSKASPRPWSTENQIGSNGWVIKAPFTSDASRNFVEYTLKKDVAIPFLIEPWTQFPSPDYKEMVESNAELIVTAVNNFDKMKEALLKASKLLQAAAIEAQRPEVEKYLSGGYRQTLEDAVFKDSLGIEQLLESLK